LAGGGLGVSREPRGCLVKIGGAGVEEEVILEASRLREPPEK